MSYVRCKDRSTGHKVSLSDEHGPIDETAYEVLKGPAVDELTGQPLPPEYAEPAPKRPARKRSSSRKAAASKSTAGQATSEKKEPSDG